MSTARQENNRGLQSQKIRIIAPNLHRMKELAQELAQELEQELALGVALGLALELAMESGQLVQGLALECSLEIYGVGQREKASVG